MRVLHLYSGNLFGGIERFLITLAEEQAANPALNHTYGLCFGGKTADELRRLNTDLHMLGEVRVSRPWTVLAARKNLRTLLRAQPFDAVITHSYWPHAVFAPAIRAARKPLIFWSHDTPDGKGWLQKWTSRTRPDLVIANSKYTQSKVPLLFNAAPSEVLYYPVSAPPPLDVPAVRKRVRTTLNTPEDRVVIIHSSRMERWKGHILHLSALARLRDDPTWECWIAGGAQRPHEQLYLEGLQRQIAADGITDRIKFLGQRSDISQLLAAADIHCQPNLGPEPFGIAFIEALYAGLPIVTTAIGAPAEYLTPAASILTPAEDAPALAAALASLIHNPAQRIAMHDAAQSLAAQLCTPHTILAQLEKVIQTAVQKSQK